MTDDKLASENAVPQADKQAQTDIAAQQGQYGQATADVSAVSGTLIAAEKKVIGVSVYNPAGETLGTVGDLMVDMPSGRIIYAVMAFGGLFGLGAQYYPVPWELLTYDTAQEGFVVNLDKERLEQAPSHGLDDTWTRRYTTEVDTYYGIDRPSATGAGPD